MISDDPKDLFINFRFDSYIIESFLGSGTYGLVFRAINLTTNTTHAVKVYTTAKLADQPSLRKYIENQVSLMGTKYHPNIANLDFHCFIPDKGYFLVMEYCNSGDLKQLIKDKGRLEEDLALEILRQLVEGFRYLYLLGLMHRDFKSRNVLVHKQPDGKTRYKIADFDFVSLGNAETYIGSMPYMAPEVLENGTKEFEHRRYQNKVDVWSLGVVFYEMLYGILPFKAKNTLKQLKKIKEPNALERALDPTVKVSATAKDFLKKALTIDKNDRADWDAVYEHQLIRGKPLSVFGKQTFVLKEGLEIEKEDWILILKEVVEPKQAQK